LGYYSCIDVLFDHHARFNAFRLCESWLGFVITVIKSIKEALGGLTSKAFLLLSI
jgi:hypothetical protein